MKDGKGKVKGMLQVLLERGEMNGKQNACDVLILETSLKLLMMKCKALKGKRSLLQACGREIGVLFDTTWYLIHPRMQQKMLETPRKEREGKFLSSYCKMHG